MLVTEPPAHWTNQHVSSRWTKQKYIYTHTHTHTTVALIQHTLEPHQPHAHKKGRMVGTWGKGGDSLTRGRPAEGSSSGSKNNSGSNSSRRPQAY